MKHILSMALLLAVLAPAQSFGFNLRGWERPILKAPMTVIKSDDVEILDVPAPANVQLTMTQQDGRQVPTGLILLIDDQVIPMSIVSEREIECGSTRYTAVPTAHIRDMSLDPVNVADKMILIDHASRVCEDFKPHRWELEAEGNGVTLMQAVGNPAPVINTL